MTHLPTLTFWGNLLHPEQKLASEGWKGQNVFLDLV
jgi:hypothetical protein